MVSFLELVRGVFRFDGAGWRPRAAILRALGVAVPLVGFFACGQAGLGVLAAIGALYTGNASYSGIQPVRVRRMLIASGLTAVIALLACLLNQGDLPVVIGGTFAAFLLALIGSLSDGANLVCVQTMGMLIVVSGIPATSANPVGNAVLVLAGGLFQSALLSLFGPIHPYGEERGAVGRVFLGLAEFVRGQEGGGALEIPDSVPFLNAIARLGEAEFHGIRAEHLPLQHAMRIAEVVRAALVGYARAYREATEMGACSDELADVNGRLARALEDVGRRIASGEIPPAVWGIEDRLECPSIIEGPMRNWLNLISVELEGFGKIGTEVVIRPRRWSWVPRVQSLYGLKASALLQGMTLNHSLRYATAVGLALAIARYSHAGHGYWFPLTVAFILRLDYATTLTRGLGRAVGTVFGVALATGVDVWLHPSVTALILLTLAATWFGYAVFQANYAWYAFAITLFVVFSITMLGSAGASTGFERLAMTLAGVGLALVFSVVWPLWQRSAIPRMLREAFEAQIAYGHAVGRMLGGEVVAEGEELKRRARYLRIEAQKLLGAAKVEPRWSRREDLESSSSLVGILAAGAAEMLYVEAQALSASKEPELGSILSEAMARAESAAAGIRG